MSDIRKISVADFFNHPSSADLLSSYGEECRISGMPRINPDRSVYDLMEKSGLVSIFGAFDGDNMDGFLVLLVSKNPHYSQLIGTIESIYVAKDKRKGGAGLELINKSKSVSKELGAVGIFISAPTHGVFGKVLEGLGAKNTNNVYFWSFVE